MKSLQHAPTTTKKWRKDGEFASVSWKATMLSLLRLELLFRCVCRCNSWNFPLGKRSGLQDRRAGDFPCLSFGPCRRLKARETSVPGRSARDIESQRSGLTKVHSALWPGTTLLRVSPHPVVSALRQGDKPDVELMVATRKQIVRVKVSVLLSLTWQPLMMWCMKSRKVNLV